MLNTHLENSFDSVSKPSSNEVHPLGTFGKQSFLGGYIHELIHVLQILQTKNQNQEMVYEKNKVDAQNVTFAVGHLSPTTTLCSGFLSYI